MILVEYELPKLNGAEFTRLLRRTRDSATDRRVPVIMLTGFTDEHRVRDALDAGVHGILAKPFATGALLARMREIIGQPRAFVENDFYIGPERRGELDPPPAGPARRARGEAADGPPAPPPAGLWGGGCRWRSDGSRASTSSSGTAARIRSAFSTHALVSAPRSARKALSSGTGAVRSAARRASFTASTSVVGTWVRERAEATWRTSGAEAVLTLTLTDETSAPMMPAWLSSTRLASRDF